MRPPLIFIDTNIWLDFYRSQTEAGISLLEHVEGISDKIIVCPQVEMEFKKNRQATILQSIRDLKAFKSVSRPGIFSDAKAATALQNNLAKAGQLIRGMNIRLVKILENPAVYDPVYKIFQRVFHKGDSLRLTRDNPIRRTIRHKALRRFLLGYPPRKNSDTSIGDAMNWEWIIHCAEKSKSNVIIVSRDSDYGILDGGRVYLNDHLRQEFSERVSPRKKLILHTRLSQALESFHVKVTLKEKEEEDRLVDTPRILIDDLRSGSATTENKSLADMLNLSTLFDKWLIQNDPNSSRAAIARALAEQKNNKLEDS